MYFGLSDINIYLYFFLFLLAVVVSWCIPGWVVLSWSGLRQQSARFLLSLPVGMVLWGVQGYLFGYLGLRFLTLIYVLVFFLIFIREQDTKKWIDFSIILTHSKRQSIWLLLAIIISAVIQVFGHIGSGLFSTTEGGVAFYFVNAVDGMMHLSYIQSLATHFPPQEPGAAGLPLVNYHYWSDLVLADIARVWRVPVIHLFFQFAPLLLSVLTTALFVYLIKKLGGATKSLAVGLLLLTFGGDAAYVITLILHGTWAQDVSSLDSGVSFYFNIPQVFARFVLITIILLLLEWWKTKKRVLGIVIILLIASLTGFKIYYALYAVLGFCFVIGFEWVQSFIKHIQEGTMFSAIQKTVAGHWHSLALLAVLATLMFAIYLPTNHGAGGLTYSFFEWPHLLLSADNIDFRDWFLRMQVYTAAGNTRNIVILNLLAVLLTGIAIYGTRMIGMVPLFRPRSEEWLKLLIFFVPTNLVFILLGLFTLQTSGGLNIFNFLIVPILSFNLIAAFNLERLPNKLFIVAFVLLCVFTIPRSALQLSEYGNRYYRGNADYVVSSAELEAFTYIRSSAPETAVIQAAPSNGYALSTPYISFFAQRPSYVSGVGLLESHNQPSRARLAVFNEIIALPDGNDRSAALQQLGITHLFIPTAEFGTVQYNNSSPVFQNETITVLEL